MQTNSRGAAISASPPPPETARSDAKGVPHATRRTGGAPWLYPTSSTETSKNITDRRTSVSRHNSAQADDYRMPSSDTSSILSGTETVAPQSHSTSWDRSGRRGPYGLLTGLLSRRGPDAKSRRTESNRSKSPAAAATTTAAAPAASSRVSPSGSVRPSTRVSRNPLVDGYDHTAGGAAAAGTQIGAGGYDWPAPPSPIKANDSIHRPGSGSRHETSASPLLSLPSHASPMGTTNGRAERRDKRSASRFVDHGESHFVPLGSSGLVNRGGSASVRRPDGEEANLDEALSTSGTTGRASVVGRRRPFGHGAAAAESPSNSESQSNELLTHTRGSQARGATTDENELSAPSSSSNVRSMRDAKAALLRHAQGVNASVRVSRQQSFHRVPSNVTGADATSHRAAKGRATSRDRRSLNGSRRDDNGGSLYSIGLDDDAVRMSISPGSMGSPMMGRPGVLFPATAANQEGNMTTTSISHTGTSRRFSRTEDGSGALLEVMETSALASQGTAGGTGSNNTGGSAARTTRGRSTCSVAKSSGGRHGNSSCRDDGAFVPSVSARAGSTNPRHHRVLSGGYSLSRTGGYDDSDGSEDSVDMEERHRHKVDEVLRMLNRPQKSTTGNNQSTMSRADTMDAAPGKERARSPNTPSTSKTAADSGNSTSNAEMANNTSVGGGGGGWSGIGGLGWGSLAGFGAAAADVSTNNSSSGGWAGLGGGGDGGSDDWYARMRKKAEEEEKAEAAAAAAATTGAGGDAPLSPGDASAVAAKTTSPGTVSMTVTPGLVVQPSPLPPAAVPLPSISEAPMPSVARKSITRRPSAVPSLRSPGTRPSVTPVTPSSHSANTSVMPTRPAGPALTPSKPSLPSTSSQNGISTVSSSTERFLRRPPGVASRSQASPATTTTTTKFGESPLDLPMENAESLRTTSVHPRRDSNSHNESVSLSGRQSTLPGAATSTASAPARRASRPGGFLAAAITANVNGDAGDAETRKQLCQQGGPPANGERESTGVVLPSLPPRRADTTTPLSTGSSAATTPGQRRFDYRRRASLPRVLPTVMGPSSGPTSVSSVSSTGPPLHTTRNERPTSTAPSTSHDVCGRSSTQPASPATSSSRNAKSGSPQHSVITIGTTGGASSSVHDDGGGIGARRNSTPSKSVTAPSTAAAANRRSSGTVATNGNTPKKPVISAAVTKSIAASTRLSVS